MTPTLLSWIPKCSVKLGPHLFRPGIKKICPGWPDHQRTAQSIGVNAQRHIEEAFEIWSLRQHWEMVWAHSFSVSKGLAALCKTRRSKKNERQSNFQLIKCKSDYTFGLCFNWFPPWITAVTSISPVPLKNHAVFDCWVMRKVRNSISRWISAFL